MEKVITKDNVGLYAYINEEIVQRPIKGIVLEFHGLNFAGLICEHSDVAKKCAENGVLYVFPYYDPWGWMNDVSVKMVDDIVAALIDKYQLGEDVPIISTGGSMGGQGALIYSRYARITPTACAVNCPVADFVFHATERPDLPRTVYCAYAHYDGKLEDALASASPYHQAEQMPDIPYYIAHCDCDSQVNIHSHSERFVEKLKQNHQVTYDIVPGRDHCDLSPEIFEKYWNFILSFAK